jgi:uncharacterized protein with PIN domain
MRFIADSMLGRLARWLRLLGFDTLYYADIRDYDLLRIAQKEERIILTRDTHFLKRKGLRGSLLVRANDSREQLREVIRAYGITEFGPGRCARCNGILHIVGEKAEVRHVVPDYIFLSYHDFLKCRACGRVYWEGTHLERFRDMIGKMVCREWDAREGS